MKILRGVLDIIYWKIMNLIDSRNFGFRRYSLQKNECGFIRTLSIITASEIKYRYDSSLLEDGNIRG